LPQASFCALQGFPAESLFHCKSVCCVYFIVKKFLSFWKIILLGIILLGIILLGNHPFGKIFF